MAESTGIAWTDATFNPWIGCTKVGPGCDHCYAETLATTRMGVGWGAGAPRRRTGEANWAKPRRWNNARVEGRTHFDGKDLKPVPAWVFCASLADWLDNEVDPAWRRDLLRLIEGCPALRWQLCTKRITNLRKMVPEGWFRSNPQAGVLVTVVNQEEACRDVRRLLRLKRDMGIKWVGLSVEPQVGPINLGGLWYDTDAGTSLDWVICGGESQQGREPARPFDLQWADDLATWARAAQVPFFMKQTGTNPVANGRPLPRPKDRAGADPLEWPKRLRVRQMPTVYDSEPAARLFA